MQLAGWRIALGGDRVKALRTARRERRAVISEVPHWHCGGGRRRRIPALLKEGSHWKWHGKARPRALVNVIGRAESSEKEGAQGCEDWLSAMGCKSGKASLSVLAAKSPLRPFCKPLVRTHKGGPKEPSKNTFHVYHLFRHLLLPAGPTIAAGLHDHRLGRVQRRRRRTRQRHPREAEPQI